MKLVFALALGLMLHAGHARAQYVAEDTARQSPQPSPSARPGPDRSEPKVPFHERLSYGGNFGASFGTVTYIEASPLVLYNFSERFQAGPGITYIYFNSPYTTTSIYGGRVLGRFIVFENIFLQAEGEALSLEGLNADFERRRYTVFSPLVGAGYRLPLGERGGVFLTALYNLNYIPGLSPYPNPLILRIGFAL